MGTFFLMTQGNKVERHMSLLGKGPGKFICRPKPSSCHKQLQKPHSKNLHRILWGTIVHSSVSRNEVKPSM